jgi:hypothetical protein
MNGRIVRIARAGSPVTYALALVLFLMPFLSVSCDAPEGFGRTTAGGTTTYAGLDLAVGNAPAVDDDHLRPVAQQSDDDLGAQPLVLAAAIGVFVALVAVLIAKRYKLAAIVGVLAATALVVGLLLARASLTVALTLLGAGLSAAVAGSRPRTRAPDETVAVAADTRP